MIREQGEAFSQLQEKYQPTPRFFRSLKFALNMERSTLYERINTRVDRMVEDGLFEEAIALYPFHALDPLKTVGYKEVFDYKEGKINQRQTIEAIKQNSRRYAKRQLTWYRREKDLHWFQPDETEAMKKMISAKL
jgi:tRNA dimethylallyltransferase